MRWTGKTPLDFHEIHLAQDGFNITLTEPLAKGVTIDPSTVDALQYDYNYWWEYGSPPQHLVPFKAQAVQISEDRKSLRLTFAALTAATCLDVKLPDHLVTEDGRPLLHREFSYTINQLPEGPLCQEQVSKVVSPPPSKENAMEGWLRLTYSDATALWDFEGWRLTNAQPTEGDDSILSLTEGDGALVPVKEGAQFLGKINLGDHKGEVEFQLTRGGSAELWLLGQYAIKLTDNPACGTVAGKQPNPAIAATSVRANGTSSPGIFRRPATTKQETRRVMRFYVPCVSMASPCSRTSSCTRPMRVRLWARRALSAPWP